MSDRVISRQIVYVGQVIDQPTKVREIEVFSTEASCGQWVMQVAAKFEADYKRSAWRVVVSKHKVDGGLVAF